MMFVEIGGFIVELQIKQKLDCLVGKTCEHIDPPENIPKSFVNEDAIICE